MSPKEGAEGQRGLGLRTATSLVIASMVGTGVFVQSGLLLESLGSVPAVLLAWLVGGVLAMTGALSYAELVAALPENGGEYHLVGAVYHPALGFASGFVSLVVGFSAPIAASALAFGAYIHQVWPAIQAVPAALGLVLIMCAVHAFRVGVGSRAQDALTAFKIVLVLGFIALGAVGIDPSRLVSSDVSLVEVGFSPAFAVAVIFVTFSYSGWNAATYVAGELEDPGRTLPRALVAGTAAVMLIYLAINMVFLASAPVDELRGEEAIGHVAAVALLGEGAGRALSVIIAFGLISTVGALVMTGTRVLDAMGRDHGPLALLARRATGGGPFVAVALQGALAIAMILIADDLEILIQYIGFTLSIFAGLTVFGVIVLRLRRPELERPYRTWLYPVTPLVFVALMVWMVAWSILAEPKVAVAGGGTIALGLVLWLALHRG